MGHSLLKKILFLMPKTTAARVITFLASFSKPPKLKPRDRDALSVASKVYWGPKGRHIAWSWGKGPVVVLVHGWGGRATQMAPLAQHLAWLGYRAIAPDFSAHGDSPGKRISFKQFIDETHEFICYLDEPIQGLIGHSAGALGMMEARRKHGVKAVRYISICGPTAPYPPIDIICRLLNPSEGILTECRKILAKPFSASMPSVYSGIAHEYQGQGELMLVYDHDDDQVRHEDADQIAEQWPNATIVKTKGLGHQKILYDDAIHVSIGDFLGQSIHPQHTEDRLIA